jgi:hypothetical protein
MLSIVALNILLPFSIAATCLGILKSFDSYACAKKAARQTAKLA